MTKYTIDASVFISAFITTEASHADSKAFVDRIKREQAMVYCPSLMIVEVAAALARTTGDTMRAEQFAQTLATAPNLILVGLAGERVQKTVHIAATGKLRGADAVYVAVAQEYSATLVTLDKEMLARAASIVPTVAPLPGAQTPESF
jgi:predicted nucleic acid-binding protein